jgi:outer membrane beta-barrel protein
MPMKTTITFALACAFALPAMAQTRNEPVVVPQVERRDLKLPQFPSKDVEVGAFAGIYSTENFGSSAVYGLRLGYHITEDFFVQANLAQTKVSDEQYRALLPGGGIFAQPEETLRYFNLSVGWNVLPGEVFIGTNRAKATSIYLLGGVGSTRLAERRLQTFNLGLGVRALVAQRLGVHLEMRDHIFSIDLLGPRQSTHNLELSGGVAWYF